MSPKNSHENLIQPFLNHSMHQNNQLQNSHRQQLNNAANASDHTQIIAENEQPICEEKRIGEKNIQEQSNGPGKNNDENHGEKRGIRPEDVLWWICFFFTARCFDLPAALIFSRKVNRQFLQIAFLCPLLLALFTLFFALFKTIFANAAYRWLSIIQLCAILCFVATPLFFCLATWDLFGVWSIFIAIVAIQSSLAFIALI